MQDMLPMDSQQRPHELPMVPLLLKMHALVPESTLES